MEKEKICVISFDHWDYDKHIVTELRRKGIESNHIKIGSFKYKNFIERLQNTFSKVFLGKNPKIIKRQEFILETLRGLGKQDQILVINPELIDVEYHLKIKAFTNTYLAFLYDSVDRYPINNLLDGVFDKIFSFDKKDVEKYGFTETTNYNYLGKVSNIHTVIKNDILYLASFDKRLEKIFLLKNEFVKHKLNYKIIIVGKKTILYRLKSFFSKKNKGVHLKRKRISQEKMLKLYSQSNIIVDIVRENQTGISFRVFEAMALEKKVITNNKSVKLYDFYNPKNIYVINNDDFVLDEFFLKTNYEPLEEELFNKYTLDHWVKKVFELQ